MATVSVLHILRTIKERGSISRTDLQQVTRLSWGTVTNTTRELLERNLILEEGAASTKAGRKPMRLALNRSSHFLVGLDIASDVIRCLVLNLAGETLWYEEQAVGPGAAGPEMVLEKGAEIARRAMEAPEVGGRLCLGVGVAAPGTLDTARGVVRFVPRSSTWKNVAARDFLQSRLSAAVRLEQHANCLAIAERWFGEAGAAEHLLCVHLGESVGMGILLGGTIFRGSQEMAGDFGHVTLDPAGPACVCGDRGCVEAYCSIGSMLEQAHSVAASDDPAAIANTFEELVALGLLQNQHAVETFARMGKYLGMGVANLIDLFNPDLVVLAGKTTAAKGLILPAILSELSTHAGRELNQRMVVSQLGERATAMGACGVILEQLFAQETAEMRRPPRRRAEMQ